MNSEVIANKSDQREKNRAEKWDVIVIGAGPAGMIAAGRAGERGKKVLLLEKNLKPGEKLLITGGGRCNLTNNKPEISTLINSYKDKPKALYSLFSRFDVTQTLDFFNSRGLETKVEAYDRVFPASDMAESVLNVLYDYVRDNNVVTRTKTSVTGISQDTDSDEIIVTTRVAEYRTTSCIVASGGLSRPETGSTGDGYKWLASLGHEIVDNQLALVPVSLTDTWSKKLSGVPLQDVRISLWQYGKKQYASTGRMLFTHFGLSGPMILNMSSRIGELLQSDKVIIEIDLLPNIDSGALKATFTELLRVNSNKMIKNTLGSLIPKSMVTPLLGLADVNGNTYNNNLRKEERVRILRLIKAIPLHVEGLMGADKAIVSAGGIKVEDVDFRTMESKISPNVYIVGDLLNIDRPSGGYSLQLCWSSGYVAGDSC